MDGTVGFEGKSPEGGCEWLERVEQDVQRLLLPAWAEHGRPDEIRVDERELACRAQRTR